jgi:RNA polymerase sigma-70 factor (ECF subfamily)
MSPPSRASDLRPVFESLYEELYADLLRFVQRRVRHDQAEDVVSDAFLVVWRRLEELPSHSDDARAWVFGIARNLLLNDRRGGQRRQALGVHLAAAAAQPNPGDRDPQVDLVVSRVDLARAWMLLSEVHQEALALTAFEDLQAPQAAAVLDISPVAFRLRLSRARRALRAHLNHLPTSTTTVSTISERTTTDAS